MTHQLTNTEYIKVTVQLKRDLEKNFFVLGERLKKIRDDELYVGVYDSFREFLEDMRMTESFASRLIKVYSTFIERFKMKPETIATVGWSALYQIAKHTENKKEATDLVELARNVRRVDLEDELRERKTGCINHIFNGDKIVLKRCITCGKWVKINQHEN